MSRFWAITGGSGLVGRFIVADLLARGERVLLLGRRPADLGFFGQALPFRRFDLDAPEAVDLSGCDGLIHCAFDHIPGRYRGGEGDDPDGFRRRNLTGTLALFAAARAAGLARGAFLSSRAVFGGYPAGTTLTEGLPPRPDTLYGALKAEAEAALLAASSPDFDLAILRATGIYGPSGPGQTHKWAGLFADHLAGQRAAPRAGTELHGADLADGLWRALHVPGAHIWHGSDLRLDRHDLLGEVNRLTGCTTAPPAPSPAPISALDCAGLQALGWRPRGWAGLTAALPQMLAQIGAPLALGGESP